MTNYNVTFLMLTTFAGLPSAHLWTKRAVFAKKLVFPNQKINIDE